MNQARYDQLYKHLEELPSFIRKKHDIEYLEDLWNSYLRESERCMRLEEELYELREEIKRLKHET